MHRSLTRRTRAAVLLVVTSLLGAVALVPLAAADDDDPGGGLEGRRSQVEGRIKGAHQELDESSAQLRRAATALDRAQTRLGAARARLADTRGRLAAAQAFDEQMADRLAAARARLQRARAELDAARVRITEEQDTLSQIVVANYQQGGPSLMGLSMVLTTQDPAALTGQLNSVQNIMDKEAASLDRLEASRALLFAQEVEVRKARAEVAEQRAAAAANLARTAALEAQAEAAAVSVGSLVEARSEARSTARRARRADLAQLRELESERDRIAAVLRRRAAQARARAAAAARAAGRAPSPATGGPVRSGGFLDYPVSGPVTSPFGWRVHPIYGYRSLHDGIDFGAACGTPIRAVADGTVLEEYFQTAWGNRIIIDHGFQHGVGLATISNHLSSYAVSAGQRVTRGQVVGYVGTTGWSTGCHLHFTVLQNGTAADPANWF